jgi:catalase-peroxidase
MGMNDEETVALIAGGHSFGKCHGAANPSKYVGAQPESAPIEDQGFGWKNSYKSGKGADTISSGLEGAWTPTPTKWDNSFFEMLFKYDWNLQKSPGGAYQWVPTDPKTDELVPDAHIDGKSSKPIMLTTDLALRMDPKYKEISKRFYENPKEFAIAFAKAWFKLTHRDMGPKSRYLGEEVPKDDLIWQDPIPKIDYKLVNSEDIAYLKKQILACGLSVEELVYTAWRSAATYRDSDKRGGANGARIRLLPQCEWEVNKPKQLERVLNRLEEIKDKFNQKGERKISLADMIVLAGNSAIERAAKLAGFDISVEFNPGRADAGEEDTDVRSFEYLKPVADGFVNYKQKDCDIPAPMLLIDMAVQLKLSVPLMSVLIGGMRSMGVSFEKNLGILTDKTGVLNNRFFVNLLDMSIVWEKNETNEEHFLGRDRESGDIKFHATSVDLIFGSNSQLRAQAEFYAQDDNQEKFVKDFVKAWQKIVELDRFDLHD